MGVNDPFIPVDYMRYMLKYDTVHGRFPNTVEVAGDSIAVGGDKVKVFGERTSAILEQPPAARTRHRVDGRLFQNEAAPPQEWREEGHHLAPSPTRPCSSAA